MSQSSTAAAPAAPASLNWFDRHYFFWRRLHSFTGIFPIGVFLIEHLYTNFGIVLGPSSFQTDVDFLWGLPGLFYLELFGIWVPLGFHGLLGLFYGFFRNSPNARVYRYGDNRRYTWMRITGAIALVYIFFHMATMRWGWNFGGWFTPFDWNDAAKSTAIAVQFAWPWVFIFYLIGLLATVYHFANGMWTAAITWGMTLTPASQRRWGWCCLALGVILAVAGVWSLWYFAVYPAHPGPTVLPRHGL